MNDCNSFSSLDRLLEFGMGMAMAQQMMNTMNQTIAQMHIPAQTNAFQKQQANYHLAINDAVAGPFTLGELETLVKAKTLTADTLVWKPGMTGWMKAADQPEVNKYILLHTSKP